MTRVGGLCWVIAVSVRLINRDAASGQRSCMIAHPKPKQKDPQNKTEDHQIREPGEVHRYILKAGGPAFLEKVHGMHWIIWIRVKSFFDVISGD
jgi:hypothetical protein